MQAAGLTGASTIPRRRPRGCSVCECRRREARFARRSDTVVTVSEPIRRVLVDRYRLAHTAVVYSCPPTRRVDEPDPRLRRALGLEDAVPLVIAHGRLTVHRGLEQLCDAMRETVTGAHLAVLGYGPLFHQLKLDSERGYWAGRLHLLEAVEPDDLLDWLSGADLAAMPIQPSTLNHFFSAPNKLFEALNAGLPVVAPDFPVFRTVLQDEAGLLGALVDPTNPLAIQRAIEEVLGRSSAERAELRRRCLRARPRFSPERATPWLPPRAGRWTAGGSGSWGCPAARL